MTNAEKISTAGGGLMLQQLALKRLGLKPLGRKPLGRTSKRRRPRATQLSDMAFIAKSIL